MLRNAASQVPEDRDPETPREHAILAALCDMLATATPPQCSLWREIRVGGEPGDESGQEVGRAVQVFE